MLHKGGSYHSTINYLGGEINLRVGMGSGQEEEVSTPIDWVQGKCQKGFHGCQAKKQPLPLRMSGRPTRTVKHQHRGIRTGGGKNTVAAFSWQGARTTEYPQRTSRSRKNRLLCG